jgi:predicted metal-dependent peptidase
VKRFLDVLSDNLSKSRAPIISDERRLLNLLLLLLNPHVTEFDFTQFSALRRSKRYHAVCKHLLRNCQNIRRVRFLNTSMELPVLQMKNNWLNLRSLSFRFHPLSQNADQILELIQKELLNIE